MVTKMERASDTYLEKRLRILSNIAVDIVNGLTENKIDGAPINVADIYFILSKALQQISVLNLAEIEEFKHQNQTNKLAV